MSRLQPLSKWAQRLLVSFLPILIPLSVIADETEIFYQNDASLVDANVMFLLDASGSMQEEVPGSGGKTRMQVMQEAFRTVLNEAPDNLNVGLAGYANADFINSYQWDSIRGVSFPSSPIDGDASLILGSSAATDNLPDANAGLPVRTFLANVVDSWKAGGYTPIVDSLYEVAKYYRGESVVWGKHPPQYNWAAHPATYAGDMTCENPQQQQCRLEWDECNGSQTACVPQPVNTCCNWVEDNTGGFCVNGDYSCSVDVNHCQQTVCGSVSGTATYKSPIEYSCQSNFLVLMSDGKPEYPYFTNVTADGTGQYAKSVYPDHVHDNALVPELTPSLGSTEISEAIPAMIGTSCADQPLGYASGTCGAELTNYLASEDQNPALAGKQTVETYTVAFGLGDEPTGSAYLASLATAKDGAYTADNAIQLAEAFKEVFGDIKKKSYSFSSPSFSVNEDSVLSHGNSVFVPVFDSKRTPLWSGNLRKFSLNQSGSIVGAGGTSVLTANGDFTANAQDLWSVSPHGSDVKVGGAASKIPLPALRKLKTDAGSNTLVDIRHSETAITHEMLSATTRRTQYSLIDNFNNFTGAPGADGWSNNGYYYDCDNNRHDLSGGGTPPVNIIDVTTCPDPVSDAEREALLNFARGYEANTTTISDPNTVGRRHMGDMLNTKPIVVDYGSKAIVLAATNEGYLHAFDADTGVEEWAFMPSVLLKNQGVFLRDNEEKRHVYGLDGSLTYWRYDQNGDGKIQAADGDKRYLFFGMRRGGRMYYAMDITNPGIPRVAWKIAPGSVSRHDNSAITNGFADLGETWSKPTLSRMRVPSASSPAGELKYVLVFGGGYDPKKDEQSVTSRAVTNDLGSDVYIVDALSGELIWSLKGASVPKSAMLKHSVPGDIRVLDMDNNGELDRLYFADTGGNVWRVDMVADLQNLAGISTFKNKAVLTHFANLGGNGDDGDHRKFFYEPDTAMRLDNGKPVMTISLGSGYRTHPLDIGDNDQFYVLVDDKYVFDTPPGNFETIENKPEHLEDINSLRNSGLSILETGKRGWYLPLSHRGEKVLAPSITFLDKVLFTTFAQAKADGSDSIAGPCQPLETTARAYVLDLLTSKPVANLDRKPPADPAAKIDTTHDDFVVAGFGEILDAPQLIFSKLTASGGGSCQQNDCQQSVSVRIGKLELPVLDLGNTKNGSSADYKESVDLTTLLPQLYWRDQEVTEQKVLTGTTK
ncbi:MAG: PilC/PilY family type IV pilus protein [Thiolinea sp.]